MCGVLGRFAWSGAPSDPAELQGLLAMLRHRGPDSGATFHAEPFFLGHRRLAILDLSDAGAQPMKSADGRYVVAFNGEIYNYVELRQELERLGHAFRTRTDTEVLLHGYDAWGESLPEHLVGMFAFALADTKERTLFLARDRFGEKPLLYVEEGGAVTFASELGPLARHLGTRRQIDLDALSGYLCLNYVPGERTMLAGVHRLRPGTSRLYDARGLKRERAYYRPGAAPNELALSASLADVQHELGRRLDEAVRISLRSDVPLALFLSGGIDSSVVAESATRQGVISAAFCLDVGEASFSEWDNAKHVADRLGLRLERVPFGPASLADFFDVVSHADDPLGDSSALAVWTLARATAREFKVAVSGDGGDELFGGYLTYQATAVHRAVTSRLGRFTRAALGKGARLRTRGAGATKVSAGYKAMRFLRAAPLPPSQAHFTWNGALMPQDAAELLTTEAARALARDAVARVARSHSMKERPALGELLRVDAAEYLPNDILTKVDRMTMAHGLESRAPLLDHRLASLAFAATPRFAGAPWQKPKRLLRSLADARLGPRVSRAKKQGFSIPVHAWLRGPGRHLVEDLLSRDSVAKTGVLDAAAVGTLRDRLLLRAEPLGFEVWGLCVLMAWFRARFYPSSESVR
jgi:asparagine synthase (glutamine-hydrolysing)